MCKFNNICYLDEWKDVLLLRWPTTLDQGASRTSNFLCPTGKSPRQTRMVKGLTLSLRFQLTDLPTLPRSSQPCQTYLYSFSPYPSAERRGQPSKMTTLCASFLPNDNSFFIFQIQKMGRCQNDQEWCPNLSYVPESTQRRAWCQIHGHSRWETALLLAAFKPTLRNHVPICLLSYLDMTGQNPAHFPFFYLRVKRGEAMKQPLCPTLLWGMQ